MTNPAEWKRRVQEWRASGQSSGAFCEGKGFTAGGLRNAAHRLGLIPAPSAAVPATRLARVVREPSVASSSTEPERVFPLPAQVATRSMAPLVVECGALRMAVRPGFDRETFAAVIDVLVARVGAR